MDKANIMVFAGRYLDHHKFIRVNELQRFIIRQPEVAKALPVEQIEGALDDLVTAGFLDIVIGDEEGAIYTRFVPQTMEKPFQRSKNYTQ